MKSVLIVSITVLLALMPRMDFGRSQDEAAAREAARGTAAHIVGPGECEDCHEAEVAALQASEHWKGFPAALESERGVTIAQAMGIAQPGKDWRCLQCHATPALKKDKLIALGGVSCESCHGGAEEWMDLHDDYGDGEKEEESGEHAAERISGTVKAGMRRPDRIHDVARACLGCHVVDDVKLVDEAGHPTGEGFELLAWSQGEVRHNYMKTDGERNLAASPERRRVLFLVGQLAALERLAPRVAAATAEGAQLNTLTARWNAAAAAVKKAHRLLGEASRLNALVSALEACAEKKVGNDVAKWARAAAEDYGRGDGRDLGPLDVMLPKGVEGQPAR